MAGTDCNRSRMESIAPTSFVDKDDAKKRRFENLFGPTWRQSPWPLLRWLMTRRFRRRSWYHGADSLPEVRVNDGTPLNMPGAHLTWIGHATFVLRLGGRLLAMDPMWSRHCVHVKRLRPVGVALQDLPALDLITVTHSHYDHLDVRTLRRLADRGAPTYIVPRGVGSILRHRGIGDIVELDWWESHSAGDLRVTLVPANHWSARGLFDVNRTLWGGFVFEGPEGTAYHSGDTAYEPRLFQAIADRFPAIDWAILPIGAYEPEWFLGPSHMTPEDAFRAFDLLGARCFVASHYGTFRLTDELDGDPPRRAKVCFDEQTRARRLWLLDIGETRILRRAADRSRDQVDREEP